MSGAVVKAPSVGSISQETLAVIERLKQTVVGDVVGWSELESLTNLDRQRASARVRIACRTLRKEYRLQFRVCKGRGIERIDHVTAHDEESPRARKRVRGAARRMRDLARSVDLDALSPDKQRQATLNIAMSELIVTSATEKTMRRLASKHEKTLTPPTPKELLARLLSE